MPPSRNIGRPLRSIQNLQSQLQQMQQGQPAVDIFDLRFFSPTGRTVGFTFRVVFNAAGDVVQEGMLRSRGNRGAAAGPE